MFHTHSNFKKLCTRFSQWILPHCCLMCRNKTNKSIDLCDPCLHDLPFLVSGCQRCAAILPNFHAKITCGQCLISPPAFRRVYALFRYEPPVSQLILKLKFNYALTHARVLGELLADKLIQEYSLGDSKPSIIVPIPLHKKRLKERGFNQALEIARPVAKKLQLPIDIKSFVRKKPTLAQAMLSGVDRKQNIKNAFGVIRPFQHKHVAVIDDIMTTGFTINEFCRLLIQQGVKTIDVWCAARALQKKL